jgi:hypothetical protein
MQAFYTGEVFSNYTGRAKDGASPKPAVFSQLRDPARIFRCYKEGTPHARSFTLSGSG